MPEFSQNQYTPFQHPPTATAFVIFAVLRTAKIPKITHLA
jgi:hypothetical protein